MYENIINGLSIDVNKHDRRMNGKIYLNIIYHVLELFLSDRLKDISGLNPCEVKSLFKFSCVSKHLKIKLITINIKNKIFLQKNQKRKFLKKYFFLY